MLRPLAVLVALPLFSAPAWAAGPSFDCGKAATIDERLICASAELSAVDLELAGTVKAAARPDLPAQQRRWVGERNAGCGLRRWMDESTLDRAVATSCLIRATRDRIAQIAAMDKVPAPFVPRLSDGQDKPLCRAFEAAQREAFRSPAYTVSAADRPWPGVTVEWLLSPQEEEAKDTAKDGRTTFIPADLNGDGSQETLVLFSRTHSWRGDMHSLLRFPAYQTALDWQRQGNPDTLGPGSSAMVRSSGQNDTYGWDWHVPAVARIDGGVYLVDEGSVWEYLAPATLYRIPASGQLQPVCTVVRQPDALGSDQVIQLHRILAGIAGGDGSCGGTLRADARIAQAAERATRLALLRPWAVPDRLSYNPPAAVEAWLKAWASQTPRNRDLYGQYQRARPAALATLTRLYGQGFGLPSPEAEAQRVLDRLVAAHFIFGADAKPEETLRQPTALTAALLDGRPAAELAPLITRAAVTAPALRPRKWDHDDLARETPLFFALRQPEAVGLLLAAGADVNAANAFGKTPLMLAAHQDQPASARLLLEAGARVGDRTRILRECGSTSFDVTIGDRTALHYAAENAGLDMIRLLVEAGADVTAKTTEGSTPPDKLDDNSRLSEAEREQAKKLLNRRR